MRSKLFVTGLTVTVFLFGSSTPSAYAQDGSKAAKAALDRAASAMGSANLKSIQYSGSGSNFAVGQSARPGVGWPRFNVKSYTRVINYETVSSREELVRTQGENPPRGGGGQPMTGEQRQVLLVSGQHAWNLTGNSATAAPTALAERLLQIWVTPHGFLKAAAESMPGLRTVPGGKKQISFLGHGRFRVTGVIGSDGMVERVRAWIANPVLGDMLVETTYSSYQDFNGVKFPARVVQKQGGFTALDLTVTSVLPNAPADIAAPDSVRQAAAPTVRVESQKTADGVWYLTGGSHHSAAVEFKDHVVVIEAPQNEERSLAVIAEVKKLVPGKPIKYLVNTHHHFDHSGGIRAFATEGATIITHQMNKAFYEQAARARRTLAPDRLSESGRKLMRIEPVASKRVLTDGDRVLELHHIKGNAHNDGILMAYLPKEKLLIEADVFTPPPPNSPPPAQPNPFSVNLYENIQRLKLDVNQIAPIHGRLVTLSDLRNAIGAKP